MEEQSFALMLRHALTEYDFERIDIGPNRAEVVLRREVYAENGKGELLEYTFLNPTLIKVLENLKSYLPAL
ncbi:MAG: hypothetical protein IBX64_05400 [Actinobacteria bacterium]|nr:hypothetical protein [Actinomycetota bacterium]